MHEKDLNNKSLLLGKITKTFGIKGGVFVYLFNDKSENVVPLKEVLLVKGDKVFTKTIDKVLHKGRVFFTDVTSIEQAQELIGFNIEISYENLKKPLQDEFYLAKILNFAVFNGDKYLGKVLGFSSNNAQDLLEVSLDDKKFFLPFIKPLITKIDFAGQKILVDIPSELTDLESIK